ncbi:MAG: DNA-deoxyinosine glycosylase [Gammaproteobacteria bacterium]
MVTPRDELSVGFPPIAGADARVLVLGSLPGRVSLEKRQYYAQPYNAFWKIMGALLGAAPDLPYERRLDVLRRHRVAVWDVLAAGERSGSLDSAIVTSSMVINDFAEFFVAQREIRLVCFNGNKAAELYRRRVLPTLTPTTAAIETQLLPSTSAAHASRTFAEKLARWSAALGDLV